MACWNNAKTFAFLRHPIPGSNGVNSMATVVTYADNADPSPETTYISFNQNATMLMILYIRKDGRRSFTKEYARRSEQFDVAKHCAHRARAGTITKADAEALVKVLKKKAPATP